MAEGTAAATKVLPENDPRGGIGVMPAWFTLGRGAIEAGTGVFCNIKQFMSTHDTAVSLMIGGTPQPTNFSIPQFQHFLLGNMDRYNSIAFTIALITQVSFIWSAIPSSGIWSMMRKKHGNGHTLQSKEVFNKIKLRRAMMIILFVLDALTDAVYASPGQFQIAGITIPVITFNSSLVVTMLFVACMWFGSTFVFINGIQCIGAFLGHNTEE